MELAGCAVRVERGEFFDAAVRRFKKNVDKAKILSDVRRHEYYTPPSERRRAKSRIARRRRSEP